MSRNEHFPLRIGSYRRLGVVSRRSSRARERIRPSVARGVLREVGGNCGEELRYHWPKGDAFEDGGGFCRCGFGRGAQRVVDGGDARLSILLRERLEDGDVLDREAGNLGNLY